MFYCILEGIRQYDSCNTGELDRHEQHQQPCLASRTPRVVVRQMQPVLSGTHCSSFVHRQMSVVFCLQRFPMKIENTRGRHEDTRGRHASNTCTPHKLESYSCCLTGTTLPLVLGVRQRCSRCRSDPCHTSRTAEYPLRLTPLCVIRSRMIILAVSWNQSSIDPNNLRIIGTATFKAPGKMAESRP